MSQDKAVKMLVLNPNSSEAMTQSMTTAIGKLDLSPNTKVQFYTAPSTAPASINDGADIAASTEAVKGDGWSRFRDQKYDGIIIACFSVHPLVGLLQQADGVDGVVTGIFESSILTSLGLLKPNEQWGIVTTGKFWEEHLSDGVKHFLGAQQAESNSKFAGVESTGLNASDFHHGVSPEVVNKKIREATKRLLGRNNVTCIVMGCAGMTGMEDQIRTAASELSGDHFARKTLKVVDGVAAGVLHLEQMVKIQRLLSK